MNDAYGTKFSHSIASIGLNIGMPIYRRQAVIREIERLGGKVTIRGERSDPIRRWIGDLSTTDFHDVDTVSLNDTQTTDADLDKLKGITKLTYLGVENTPITDSGLQRLAGLGLTGLTWLVIDDTQVTDAGIKHLEARSNLELLNLTKTRVTESGVAELKRALPRLEITK